MTKREAEILELIRENPMISQLEIAQRLSITRSSVGVHIKNLVEKGAIRGRGYLINGKDTIVVVGGANMDLRGFSKGPIRLEDSNPGTLSQSGGGVGRNIGENLARLGFSVDVITALGDDVFGRALQKQAPTGLSFRKSIVFPGARTPVYLEVLDDEKNMVVAISDMALVDRLDMERLSELLPSMRHSRAGVMDTNLPEKTIVGLLRHVPIQWLIDGVSGAKVVKLRGHLKGVEALKINHLEAEVLLERSLPEEKDITLALEELHHQGVGKVIITLGGDGVMGFDGKKIIRLGAEDVEVKNATGAGDAFAAGFWAASLRGEDFERALLFGRAASSMALLSEETNPKEMDFETLKKRVGGQGCSQKTC